MKLTLEPKDYENALGADKVKLEIMSKPIEVLGDDQESREEKVLDYLPQVLASKMREIMPSGFKIMEIEMKISIGGKPFGVGIDGEAIVKFGPERTT